MTQVKICGITNTVDALVAAEAKADLLGFVFYPLSPRYVNPTQARQITAAVRNASDFVRLVGVFVDENPGTVRELMSCCDLDYAQLHGTEPPEIIATLMDQGVKVIKGFRVRDVTSLTELERYRATAYLLDTYVLAQPGGTGKTFDWRLAAKVKEHGPLLLAGGLTPDNVVESIHTADPWGVDVSTGVESAPGRKDHDRLRRFISAVKDIHTEESNDKR